MRTFSNCPAKRENNAKLRYKDHGLDVSVSHFKERGVVCSWFTSPASKSSFKSNFLLRCICKSHSCPIMAELEAGAQLNQDSGQPGGYVHWLIIRNLYWIFGTMT